MTKPLRIPKLCHHKSTGLAYVTDPRVKKEVYLGRWGTPQAEDAYRAWAADYLLSGQKADPNAPAAPHARPRPFSPITVDQLLERYLDHAETYYVKDGKITSEVGSLRQVARTVSALFGMTRAQDFTPGRLLAVREVMVTRGLSRNWINSQVHKVRRVWRWGVEQELVSAQVWQALQAVAGLRRGRTLARETEPILPADRKMIEAAQACMRPMLRDMVSVHLLTGMRAQDLLTMCGSRFSLNTTDDTRSPNAHFQSESRLSCGSLWLYQPRTHKTEHLGKARRIWLGPAAQKVLQPWLERAGDGWLWPAKGRGRSLGRGPGHLGLPGYELAIKRACARAGLAGYFTPLQIRHTALTEIRAAHGLEAAQAAAGHARADVTQIYAERDEALARRVALARS
jgi:site-specific recombinase XerD